LSSNKEKPKTNGKTKPLGKEVVKKVKQATEKIDEITQKQKQIAELTAEITKLSDQEGKILQGERKELTEFQAGRIDKKTFDEIIKGLEVEFNKVNQEKNRLIFERSNVEKRLTGTARELAEIISILTILGLGFEL
jgi:broad specificity phosphatase PhoE